jgi:transcriptional regulator with XRE-family HTH domain
MSSYPFLVQQSLAELGQRIAVARKARGYTQGDFAAMAGVGLSTLVGIEGGHPGVSAGNLAKVLDTLGLLDQLGEVASPERDPFVVAAGVKSLSGGTSRPGARSGAARARPRP